jgi:AraC family transcriptional activator of pobA
MIRYDSGVHWCEEASREKAVWSLVLVSYGKCVYGTEQSKFLVEKGDVLLLPPSTGYYGKCIPFTFHEKYVVSFTACATGPDAQLPLPVLEQKRIHPDASTK